MKPPIFPEGATATFADYFKLNADVEDVLAYFGYSFAVESLKLPHKVLDTGPVTELKRRLERALPHVSLTSEMARREFLISPVVVEAALHADARIKVEYPLNVDEQLKGTLDYFLRAQHNFLIVEAKHGDLTGGFKQLAVELVALDRWAEESTESRLHGAVSMGDVWKFGCLDRSRKQITEDLNTYGVPTHLEEVLQILVGILTT